MSGWALDPDGTSECVCLMCREVSEARSRAAFAAVARIMSFACLEFAAGEWAWSVAEQPQGPVDMDRYLAFGEAVHQGRFRMVFP